MCCAEGSLYVDLEGLSVQASKPSSCVELEGSRLCWAEGSLYVDIEFSCLCRAQGPPFVLSFKARVCALGVRDRGYQRDVPL